MEKERVAIEKAVLAQGRGYRVIKVTVSVTIRNENNEVIFSTKSTGYWLEIPDKGSQPLKGCATDAEAIGRLGEIVERYEYEAEQAKKLKR